MSNIDFDKLNVEIPLEPAPERQDMPSAAPVAVETENDEINT